MKKPYNDDKFLPKRWVGCDIEESYLGDDRKTAKKDRKLASAKDRSKYKKTDREKMEKRSKKELPENLLRGRVLSIVPEGIIVEQAHESIICGLRGLLKKEKTQYKNLVTVGDFVLFEKTEPAKGLIRHIEQRRSVLSRADNLSRRKEQLIAANIDQVLITISVVSPLLRPFIADRYIIAAQRGNMDPIVVVNKIDLLGGEGAEIEEQRELYRIFLEGYSAAGINVCPVSVVTGEGLDKLKEIMTDKTSVFSGQSGVGKSSLINALTNRNLEIRDVVEKTKKGAHTTSTTNLLSLPFGGWCIDTPGIKSFGLWDLNKEDVEQYFNEIYEQGRSCRYPNCSHTVETGCSILSAVEKGTISPLRYQSYLSLMESIQAEHLRR